MTPYVVKNVDGEKFCYDIYSMLLEERIIFIDGEINNSVASCVITQLLHLEAEDPNKDITIYINSPGGEVSSGLAIIDAMNFVKCDIKVIVIGIAASMAAVILSNGTKGKRYCLPNSDVLIHCIRNTGISGTFYDIKIDMDRTADLNHRTSSILAKNTNHSIKQIENDTKRDKWLNAKEALQYGIIDEIITNTKK